MDDGTFHLSQINAGKPIHRITILPSAGEIEVAILIGYSGLPNAYGIAEPLSQLSSSANDGTSHCFRIPPSAESYQVRYISGTVPRSFCTNRPGNSWKGIKYVSRNWRRV